LIIPYEYVLKVNEILYNFKVGGMTIYDIKDRGRAKQEPLKVGTNVTRYSQNTDLELK
jgi:hypothetical protein